MPKNVNTTTYSPANAPQSAATAASAKPVQTLEQGITNIREVFRQARRMDIRITEVEGADRLGNVIEGGVNGYMFALQRGMDIRDVPEPIIEVLRNAGIGFSMLSGWKEAV